MIAGTRTELSTGISLILIQIKTLLVVAILTMLTALMLTVILKITTLNQLLLLIILLILMDAMIVKAHAGTAPVLLIHMQVDGNNLVVPSQLLLKLLLAILSDSVQDKSSLTGPHGDFLPSETCPTKSKWLKAASETGEL